MKWRMMALAVLLTYVLVAGCTALDIFDSDPSDVVSEEASAEMAAQIVEYLEETFRLPIPDAATEALADFIEDTSHDIVEQLLEAAEARKRESKDPGG